MFLCYADEGLIVSFVVADEGGVGLDDDFVLVAVIDDCSLLAPWVKLMGKDVSMEE